MRTFDFMKQFREFATIAAASGGSAPSRYAYAVTRDKLEYSDSLHDAFVRRCSVHSLPASTAQDCIAPD
jgi:hypothetical protein